MKESTRTTFRDVGLLLLRLGIGGMFVYCDGWGSISGGVKKWTELGEPMRYLGVTSGFAFWGFVVASSEFFGGMCIALGVFFRPMCALLAFAMFLATLKHLHGGTEMQKLASYQIELGVLMLSLIFIGPGRFSLGRLIGWKGRKSAGAGAAPKK